MIHGIEQLAVGLDQPPRVLRHWQGRDALARLHPCLRGVGDFWAAPGLDGALEGALPVHLLKHLLLLLGMHHRQEELVGLVGQPHGSILENRATQVNIG